MEGFPAPAADRLAEVRAPASLPTPRDVTGPTPAPTLAPEGSRRPPEEGGRVHKHARVLRR